MLPRRSLVSVALCTYHGAAYLPMQLASIAQQSRLPDELVVCDDRSSDATVELLHRFAKTAPFAVSIHINPTNRRSTKNFEGCVERCQGDVIVLCDQDDVWQPQKLAALLHAFQENPDAGYVFSNARLVDDRGQPIEPTLWESIGRTSDPSHWFSRDQQLATLLHRNVVTGATMAFRSPLKPLILPFSPHWIHDGWIVLLATLAGLPGIALPELLIDYRQHRQQLCGASLPTVTQKWKRKSSAAERLQANLRAFVAIRRRLRDRGVTLAPTAAAALDAKLRHLACRYRLTQQPLLDRAAGVYREWRAGLYADYSNRWHSVWADLLVR